MTEQPEPAAAAPDDDAPVAAPEPVSEPADDAAAEPEAPTVEQTVAAALAEVDGTDVVHTSFAGVDFTFSLKKLDSVQFRRLMQRGRDLLAIEWLIGTPTFDKILLATADPDGVTSDDEFNKIWAALSGEAGSGNSSGSTS